MNYYNAPWARSTPLEAEKVALVLLPYNVILPVQLFMVKSILPAGRYWVEIKLFTDDKSMLLKLNTAITA